MVSLNEVSQFQATLNHQSTLNVSLFCSGFHEISVFSVSNGIPHPLLHGVHFSFQNPVSANGYIQSFDIVFNQPFTGTVRVTRTSSNPHPFDVQSVSIDSNEMNFNTPDVFNEHEFDINGFMNHGDEFELDDSTPAPALHAALGTAEHDGTHATHRKAGKIGTKRITINKPPANNPPANNPPANNPPHKLGHSSLQSNPNLIIAPTLPTSLGKDGQVLSTDGTDATLKWTTGLPPLDPDGASIGKVLRVTDDGMDVEWGDGLPEINTGAAGDTLMLIDDGVYLHAEWTPMPKELPATSGEAGKFLKVDSNGTGVEWDDSTPAYDAQVGLSATNAILSGMDIIIASKLSLTVSAGKFRIVTADRSGTVSPDSIKIIDFPGTKTPINLPSDSPGKAKYLYIDDSAQFSFMDRRIDDSRGNLLLLACIDVSLSGDPYLIKEDVIRLARRADQVDAQIVELQKQLGAKVSGCWLSRASDDIMNPKYEQLKLSAGKFHGYGTSSTDVDHFYQTSINKIDVINFRYRDRIQISGPAQQTAFETSPHWLDDNDNFIYIPTGQWGYFIVWITSTGKVYLSHPVEVYPDNNSIKPFQEYLNAKKDKFAPFLLDTCAIVGAILATGHTGLVSTNTKILNFAEINMIHETRDLPVERIEDTGKALIFHRGKLVFGKPYSSVQSTLLSVLTKQNVPAFKTMERTIFANAVSCGKFVVYDDMNPNDPGVGKKVPGNKVLKLSELFPNDIITDEPLHSNALDGVMRLGDGVDGDTIQLGEPHLTTSLSQNYSHPITITYKDNDTQSLSRNALITMRLNPTSAIKFDKFKIDVSLQVHNPKNYNLTARANMLNFNTGKHTMLFEDTQIVQSSGSADPPKAFNYSTGDIAKEHQQELQDFTQIELTIELVLFKRPDPISLAGTTITIDAEELTLLPDHVRFDLGTLGQIQGESLRVKPDIPSDYVKGKMPKLEAGTIIAIVNLPEPYTDSFEKGYTFDPAYINDPHLPTLELEAPPFSPYTDTKIKFNGYPLSVGTAVYISERELAIYEINDYQVVLRMQSTQALPISRDNKDNLCVLFTNADYFQA